MMQNLEMKRSIGTVLFWFRRGHSIIKKLKYILVTGLALGSMPQIYSLDFITSKLTESAWV